MYGETRLAGTTVIGQAERDNWLPAGTLTAARAAADGATRRGFRSLLVIDPGSGPEARAECVLLGGRSHFGEAFEEYPRRKLRTAWVVSSIERSSA